MFVMNSSQTSILAQHSFGSTTGTSQYYSIPAGSHHLGYVENGTAYYFIDTDVFSNNYRYTFEFDSSGFWIIPDGAYSTQQLNTQEQPIRTKLESIKVIDNIKDFIKY